MPAKGHDVAASSVDYVLGAGVSVELMTTGWIGGSFTLALTGNELGNEIWGNDGINALRAPQAPTPSSASAATMRSTAAPGSTCWSAAPARTASSSPIR